MKKPALIVANWKLHPKTLKEAERLLSSYVVPRGISLAVCPPAVFLHPLRKSYKGRISFGVQNIFHEKEGAYTGEIAPGMALDAGALYALVGHAERRAQGEDDALVARKVAASARAGLTAVLCVGERERDEHGFYLNRLKEQVEKGLAEITPALLKQVVIAYEPLWAIGAGAAAVTPRELLETILYLRKVLHALYKDRGLAVPVLYGGSVTSENARAFLDTGEADGLLVGRESLKSKNFNLVLQSLAHA